MKISEKKMLEFILAEAEVAHDVPTIGELSFEYDEEIGITWENIAAFCKHKLVKIDERYEKNKEYKSKKQSEKNDTLNEAILGIVGEDPMSISQIAEALNDDTVSVQMIGVRVGKLVKEGILESELKSIEGRRLKFYRKAV